MKLKNISRILCSSFLCLSLFSQAFAKASSLEEAFSEEESFQTYLYKQCEDIHNKGSEVYAWFAEEPIWRVVVPTTVLAVLSGAAATFINPHSVVVPTLLVVANSLEKKKLKSIVTTSSIGLAGAATVVVTADLDKKVNKDLVMKLLEYATKNLGTKVFNEDQSSLKIRNIEGMFRTTTVVHGKLVQMFEKFTSENFESFGHDEVNSLLKSSLKILKVRFNPTQPFSDLEKALLDFMYQFVGQSKTFKDFIALAKAVPTFFIDIDNLPLEQLSNVEFLTEDAAMLVNEAYLNP